MTITEKDRTEAQAWMQEETARYPKAVAARYDKRLGKIVVQLDSALELMFPPQMAQGLENAAPAALAQIEISANGTGLYWPELDADLYVPGLIGGIFGSKTWMAKQLGAAGGRVSSQNKTTSSRENGKKGGRPRKLANTG